VREIDDKTVLIVRPHALLSVAPDSEDDVGHEVGSRTITPPIEVAHKHFNAGLFYHALPTLGGRKALVLRGWQRRDGIACIHSVQAKNPVLFGVFIAQYTKCTEKMTQS
jgi:hypothetical protein